MSWHNPGYSNETAIAVEVVVAVETIVVVVANVQQTAV